MKSIVVVALCAFVVAVNGEGAPAGPIYKCRKLEGTLDCILRINQQTADNDEDDGAFSSLKQIELFEGDIVMTKRLKADIAEQRIRAEEGMEAYDAATRGKWPNARVPYRFAPGFQYTSVVYQAIADYKKKTCVRLVPYTAAEARKAGGYINFMHGGGCYSQIGKVGGKQDVSLGNGCNYKGTAIHEIMHALGFYHEQSRRDRDSYITIHWNNIPRAMWSNFQKYRAGEASTLNEPYDKKSVMHYGNYAFSTNGKATIVSKTNPKERLGTQFQQTGLSTIDTNQMNKHYKCGGTTVVTKRPTTKCSNIYSFCTALSGWCANVFVKTNCKKTCNGCVKVTQKPKVKCSDNNQHCRSWTRSGYCTSGRSVQWMKQNCKKSCKTC